MFQIISDKSSDWTNWISEVIDRLLNEYPSITRMALIAEVDDSVNSHAIEFMNCSTSDVYSFGGILQKEAIKHEMIEELDLDDETWEEWDEQLEGYLDEEDN